MTEILLCSSNPLLIKSLYGILRDEGYTTEIADHPALAVEMAFRKKYRALIIDPEPFGLPVEDAVNIIKTVHPEILVIFIGCDTLEMDALSIEIPVDLEEFKQALSKSFKRGYA